MLNLHAIWKKAIVFIVCGVLLGISFNTASVAAPTTPRMYVDTYPSSGAGDIIDESLRPGQIPISASLISSYPSSHSSGYGNVSSFPGNNAFNGSWTNPTYAYDKDIFTAAENNVASPFKTFYSFASSHAANGTVTNPTYAYDNNPATTAVYSMSGNPAPPQATYFEVKTFNATGTYNSPKINLYVSWNATVGEVNQTTNYSEFRMLYYVGAISNVLLPWVSLNVSIHTELWRDVFEPNDGVWSLADISSIKIRVETRKIETGGTAAQYGSVRIVDAWVRGGEYGFSRFGLNTFNMTGPYNIVSVNFKMRYDVGVRGSSYRILFYVGSQYRVLQDWIDENMTVTEMVWLDQPEPNDVAWSTTDISNIVFRVETRKDLIDGGGTFKLYEASVYFLATPMPAGLLSNPTNAYDNNLVTYAEIDISKNLYPGYSWFDIGGFNTSIAKPYHVLGINIKMKYTATPLSNAQYRIVLSVGDATDEIQTWTAVPRTSTGNRTWTARPEPNDAVWNWTDISNMKISFQTKRTAAGGSGLVRPYDVWVELLTDRLVLSVSVEDVVNLFSYQFYLNWTGDMLNVLDAEEGRFLQSGASTSFSVKKYNGATGNYTLISSTRVGTIVGVTGSGVLAYIEFLVEGYGCTNLQMYNTGMSDTFAMPIVHTTAGGYFRNKLVGDADGDGTVNVFDILKVKYHWYPGPPAGAGGYDRNVDCDDDGSINVFDILIVKANWGDSV